MARKLVDKDAPGMAVATVIAIATLLLMVVGSAVGVFVYNHQTFAAKETVKQLEQQTVKTFEDLDVQRTLEELEKLDAKEEFNTLNQYEKVRKKQLERKLDAKTKETTTDTE